LHRLRHREIGLAGASRTDAEGDGVLVDGVDIALLVQGLGTNRAATAGQDVLGEDLGRTHAVGAHRDDPLDGLGAQALAGTQDGDDFGECLGRSGDVAGCAGERELVSAHMDVGRQLAFHDCRWRQVPRMCGCRACGLQCLPPIGGQGHPREVDDW